MLVAFSKRTSARSLARAALRLLVLGLSISVLTLPARAAEYALPERVDFNEHIRPLLSDRCFFCHGPDEKRREADLRLDTQAGAAADLGGYQAIAPGEPQRSAMLERMGHSDPEMRMPPAASKKPPLNAYELALVERWIAQGAEYEGHWAFLPLSRTPPPQIANPAWAHNPIDQFIAARLEAVGLEPSAEADRATLIRRLALDLTGLLPSPDEVRAFVEDDEPRAYERLVERLLASPHYGERWGRHWLDQARYADSHGYTIDGERPMWPYRDWVIRALNRDMPFDRFSIEQLAGDLLDDPSKDQLIATAFHRNTLINQEGGTDDEQFRVEATIDRVNTTGAVWLGLTLGCAQCHSHKFDPVSQRDYYELMAFFNSTVDVNNAGPTVRVVPGELFGVAAQPKVEAGLSDAEREELRVAWQNTARERLTTKRQAAERAGGWVPADYLAYSSAGGAEFELLDDQSLLVRGGSKRDAYTLQLRTTLPRVVAVRLRVLTHDALPKQGPGRAANGNFVLTRFEVRVGDVQQKLVDATADHEQPRYGVLGALDDDPQSGWAVNVGAGSTAIMNANHEAVFLLAEPLAFGEPSDTSSFSVHLLHEANDDYTIGRLAIDVAAAAPLMHGEQEVLAALNTPAESRTDLQKSRLEQALVKDEPRAAKVEPQPVPGTADVMIMRDLAEPRDTFLLTRGDFTRPDKALGPLTADVPDAFVPRLAAEPSRNRLQLAQWLVHPDNPLTARVTMNRVWMHFFGRGIVETDEDFGAQGAAPSHPALLDWLAAEFLRQGWSLKAMQRLIVCSATYRQASVPRADLNAQDPRNVLLGRQERFRLEAEAIRDAALSASGLLAPMIGGPSVHPPQPEGVYAFTQSAKTWNAATDANRYRRGMYTFFYRSAPYPLFTTFDAPDFQTTCTRRLRSNTPLQSLTLSNDEAFLELAGALAARMLKALPGDDAEKLDERIAYGMLCCLSRTPTDLEAEILRDFYERQRALFRADPQATQQWLENVPVLAAADPPTAAAMLAVARALINTDNFVTRE